MPRPARPQYLTVKDWAHLRTIQVDLDGRMVDYRLPDLAAFVAQGKVPNPLRALAGKLLDAGLDERDLSDAERLNYISLQCHIIASHLVRPNLLKEFGSEEAAASWVLENMPPSHREILWQRSVFHVTDPGLMEAVKSILDLAPFRDGNGRADAQPSGEQVGAGTK